MILINKIVDNIIKITRKILLLKIAFMFMIEVGGFVFLG
jgi:hypothetical protein